MVKDEFIFLQIVSFCSSIICWKILLFPFNGFGSLEFLEENIEENFNELG